MAHLTVHVVHMDSMDGIFKAHFRCRSDVIIPSLFNIAEKYLHPSETLRLGDLNFGRFLTEGALRGFLN